MLKFFCFHDYAVWIRIWYQLTKCWVFCNFIIVSQMRYPLELISDYRAWTRLFAKWQVIAILFTKFTMAARWIEAAFISTCRKQLLDLFPSTIAWPVLKFIHSQIYRAETYWQTWSQGARPISPLTRILHGFCFSQDAVVTIGMIQFDLNVDDRACFEMFID